MRGLPNVSEGASSLSVVRITGIFARKHEVAAGDQRNVVVMTLWSSGLMFSHF